MIFDSYKTIHFCYEDGRDPVQEFLDGITDVKQQVATSSNISRLEQTGLTLCQTNACKVFNIKKQLYELVKGDTRIVFFADANTFVLLHGFQKGSQKTFRSDKKLIEERRKDYIKRFK